MKQRYEIKVDRRSVVGATGEVVMRGTDEPSAVENPERRSKASLMSIKMRSKRSASRQGRPSRGHGPHHGGRREDGGGRKPTGGRVHEPTTARNGDEGLRALRHPAPPVGVDGLKAETREIVAAGGELDAPGGHFVGEVPGDVGRKTPADDRRA